MAIWSDSGGGVGWPLQPKPTHRKRELAVNSKLSLFGFYSLNPCEEQHRWRRILAANQYDLRSEYGPASNDIRTGVFGARLLPLGLRLNPFVSMQSGSPYNIVTSQDVLRRHPAHGEAGPCQQPESTGCDPVAVGFLDPNPTPGETILPRNYGRALRSLT